MSQVSSYTGQFGPTPCGKIFWEKLVDKKITLSKMLRFFGESKKEMDNLKFIRKEYRNRFRQIYLRRRMEEFNEDLSAKYFITESVCYEDSFNRMKHILADYSKRFT